MWDLLGLSDGDEAVYRHCLTHPGSTARQAARAMGVSEDRVAASRKRLIASGLLRREQSGEVRATPAGPALIAERLRDQLDAEHARRRTEVSVFQIELTRLINDHLLAPSTSARPQVDRITSADLAEVRIAELLCSARAEVVLARPVTEPGGRAEHAPVIPAELKAAERGVDVRAIYPPTMLLSPAGRRLVDHEIRAGIAIRTAPTPAATMTIIDRCVAVLVDHRNGDNPTTLLVREALLVHTLHHLFEAFWAQASDATSFFVDGMAAPIAEVSAEERLVLQLLGDGLKDESVAKRLGISVRSVRRKISDLLRRLRAESRFQAGVLAAQRGWIAHTHGHSCTPAATANSDTFRAGAAPATYHVPLCPDCVARLGERDPFP
ncbi:MAG TPA: LuxR C-terminal-related transcriptional regulator [Micromonosporaceae bacterium]